MSPVAWQPWHTAAFLEAQQRRRPVLLLLETAWAPACAAAHAAVFSRPDVRQAIADAVVPVRVDADRRPDIADRYGLGHWPSVLVLTPEGRVVTGGTQLDEAFAVRVRQAAAAFAAHDRAWRARPSSEEEREPGVGGPTDAESSSDADALARIADGVWAARDPSSGAWLPGGRPCATAALFALAQARSSDDPAWLASALATLDALHASVIDDGSMQGPDGTDDAHQPRPARLDERAACVIALARALQLTGHESWRPRLAAAAETLVRTFRRDDGTWRPWVGAPDLELVEASALACRALLAAADALDAPARAVEAIDGLEVLAPRAYARGAGVSHVIERGQPRGPMLLDDAMALAHALLDAQGWRDEPVYRDLAEELLRTSCTRLATPAGALTDRVASLAGGGRIGRLADPWPPLPGNASAARLVVRLWPDDPSHAEEARRWLRAVSPAAAQAGALGACVGLAWHALEPSGHAAAAW